MKSGFKSIFSALIALAMVVSIAACSNGTKQQNSGTDPKVSNTSSDTNTSDVTDDQRTADQTLRPDAATVSYTVDASAAVSSGKLPEDIAKKLINKGLLLKNANFTLLKESKFSEDTNIRLFKTFDIDIVFENDRIKSINGVENGACGDGSRWIIKVNGKEHEGSADSIGFANGDTIEIVYICN